MPEIYSKAVPVLLNALLSDAPLYPPELIVKVRLFVDKSTHWTKSHYHEINSNASGSIDISVYEPQMETETTPLIPTDCVIEVVGSVRAIQDKDYKSIQHRILLANISRYRYDKCNSAKVSYTTQQHQQEIAQQLLWEHFLAAQQYWLEHYHQLQPPTTPSATPSTPPATHKHYLSLPYDDALTKHSAQLGGILGLVSHVIPATMNSSGAIVLYLPRLNNLDSIAHWASHTTVPHANDFRPVKIRVASGEEAGGLMLTPPVGSVCLVFAEMFHGNFASYRLVISPADLESGFGQTPLPVDTPEAFVIERLDAKHFLENQTGLLLHNIFCYHMTQISRRDTADWGMLDTVDVGEYAKIVKQHVQDVVEVKKKKSEEQQNLNKTQQNTDPETTNQLDNTIAPLEQAAH